MGARPSTIELEPIQCVMLNCDLLYDESLNRFAFEISALFEVNSLRRQLTINDFNISVATFRQRHVVGHE